MNKQGNLRLVNPNQVQPNQIRPTATTSQPIRVRTCTIIHILSYRNVYANLTLLSLQPAGGSTLHRVLRSKRPVGTVMADVESENEYLSDCSNPESAQAKANRIIQQAIDKANREGRSVQSSAVRTV